MNEKYEIVKFYDAAKRPRVQRKMGKMSKADAQRLCGREDSSTHSRKMRGKNWMLGFRRVS